MATCHGCGGVIGRDCFNPQECEMITRSMAAEYQTQPDYQSQIKLLIEAMNGVSAILNNHHGDDRDETPFIDKFFEVLNRTKQ
jgi:hypothetical protein